MTDYPDFQVYANAQSDNLFTAFSQTLAPGTHHGPVLPCLSWSSVTVIVTPSAGGAQVQLGHFADAAGTEQIDSTTWPVNTTTSLSVRSPLRGKYMRLTVTVTSAGDLTAETWAQFLSASSDRISFPVSHQGTSAYDATTAAGGTDTYSPGELCAGTALFYFKPYDTTASLYASIHAVDELGNPGALIADFGTPAATVQQLITVPDQILQVEIDNQDTVSAHSYDFALTIPPQ